MTLIRFKKFKDLNESLSGVMTPIDTFTIRDDKVKELYFILANNNNFTKNNSNEVILDGIEIVVIKYFTNYNDTILIQSPTRTNNLDHFKYIDLFFNISEKIESAELQNYLQKLRSYFE